MKKVLVVSISLVLVVPILASAAVFGGGDSYSLSANSTIEDDLYAAGGSVVVNGSVKGDLVTAGGNILVTGNIAEDVIAAGGSVMILSDVGDDARLAGGQLTLSGNVKGDVVVAGGQFQLVSGATVSGDLIVGAGQVVIDGTVLGGLRPKGGKIIINGQIKDSIEIWATDKVEIGPGAVIEGSVTYHAPKEAVIDPKAQIKGVLKFEKTKELGRISKGAALGLISFGFLLKVIAWLIAAYAALHLMQQKKKDLVNRALTHFWQEVLRGLIIAIVMPIVGVALIVTLVGSLLGVTVLLAYALIMIIAFIWSGVIFGAWLWHSVFKKTKEELRSAQVVVGVILLALIGLIPLLGWIVSALFCLVSLGVVSSTLAHSLKRTE